MFSKIFLSVLLLTCVYTYMLKSIKDNNDTNFQKLPDNFNFELSGIQTVKPNLKNLNMLVVKPCLREVFGKRFVKNLDQYMIDSKDPD